MKSQKIELFLSCLNDSISKLIAAKLIAYDKRLYFIFEKYLINNTELSNIEKKLNHLQHLIDDIKEVVESN